MERVPLGPLTDMKELFGNNRSESVFVGITCATHTLPNGLQAYAATLAEKAHLR